MKVVAFRTAYAVVDRIIDHLKLTFVGDVGGHPGDELQIIHRLLLGTHLAIPVTRRKPMSRRPGDIPHRRRG